MLYKGTQPICPIITVGTQPVVETLTVTPSTTAQTLTTPSGVDGYNTIQVSAVTASIDSDIVAGNIKNGVNILGVTGTYEGSGGGGGILEQLMADIVAGNNPVSVTALQAAETQINAFLSI